MTDPRQEDVLRLGPPWKGGSEFLPFHPSASHITPEYRDGWNACYLAVMKRKERRRTNPMTGAPWRLTDPQIAAELDAELAAMKADPAKARQWLIECGMLTADGRLPEEYGGEPKEQK